MSTPAKSTELPLVVVGSANADIYVEIDRLPKEGETIAARSGQTLAGGKGANQAACGGRLSYPTYFVGQVGKDAHGTLLRDALSSCGVHLDYLNTVSVPTGHAVVMLQPGGENSIIIVGGANISWPSLEDGMSLSINAQQVICQAGIVLLQREVPDSLNVEVAKIARSANVPVILDAGGMEGPIPEDLLKSIDIFSPNETELARLTGTSTDNVDQVIEAARKCHKMGVKKVLVKLGAQGSVLVAEDFPPIIQPAIPAPIVLDTTGAGDTFTAAFAVALVEGKSPADSLKFAAAAASLCIQVKGAIPSMPDRQAVLQLLQDMYPSAE
eukprot:Gb_32608 [translate_table: standard]